SEALDAVIIDAAKLGYTDYVLDNGKGEISSGSTAPEPEPARRTRTARRIHAEKRLRIHGAGGFSCFQRRGAVDQQHGHRCRSCGDRRKSPFGGRTHSNSRRTIAALRQAV